MDISNYSDPPLRVLSLDGGGIRGKSSLLILENIMERIRESEGLESVPRPCDRFDLIGGTSTGGIIAIMLGRLGMTVDECIQAYDRVGQTAFTPKSRIPSLVPPKGTYSAKALETAIKEVVKTHCKEPPCISRRQQGELTAQACPHGDIQFRSHSCTKTVVLAITKENVDAPPTLFTTYDKTTPFKGCTIWQVARATSAATTFFKSIKLGRDGIEFVDAGFGYNNPCRVLVDEAKAQFPKRSQLHVLSIGTGLGDVVTINDSRVSILKALKNMATTSKKVARDLDKQFDGDGKSLYQRFNVDRGLEDITLADWKKASNISAHTNNYLEENQRIIRKFVEDFASRPQRQPSIVDEPRELPTKSTHHYLPLQRNRRFVGREKIFLSLRQKFFEEKCDEVALFGLGGIGKSQVALEFAHWTMQNQHEYSVFWTSALSNGTFDQTFKDIAKILGITSRTNDEDLNKLVCQFLSSDKAGKWLLIVDNADDTEILFGPPGKPGGIHKYLPKSEEGLLLFTTRSREVARGEKLRDIVEIPKMELEEATKFLEKLPIPSTLLEDKKQVSELIEELASLPLAIAQAVAYLDKNPGLSIAKYIDLLRSEQPTMVRLMSTAFNDDTLYEKSQGAVATTWLVSFRQIQNSDDNATRLLSFFACIEPKAIPESALPSLQSEIDLIDAISTLWEYSFIERRTDRRSLDMHSLVHLAARVWLDEHGRLEATRADAIRHISKVFPADKYENREICQEYLPHALRLLKEGKGIGIKERFNLSEQVGAYLSADGRYEDAVSKFEQTYEWKKERFPEGHPDRLTSQHALATAYRDNGQTEKAIELLEKVVKIESTTLKEDHLDRLASQHELAKAYRDNRQTEKAIELLEKVVKIESTTLKENHPDRLTSQHALATAYRDNEQTEKAIKLLEKVVKIRITLREDHPDRLTSQHALATAYRDNGQIKKAIELLEKVVKIESTLREDHPDRLAVTARRDKGSVQGLHQLESNFALQREY